MSKASKLPPRSNSVQRVTLSWVSGGVVGGRRPLAPTTRAETLEEHGRHSRLITGEVHHGLCNEIDGPAKAPGALAAREDER